MIIGALTPCTPARIAPTPILFLVLQPQTLHEWESCSLQSTSVRHPTLAAEEGGTHHKMGVVSSVAGRDAEVAEGVRYLAGVTRIRGLDEGRVAILQCAGSNELTRSKCGE